MGVLWVLTWGIQGDLPWGTRQCCSRVLARAGSPAQQCPLSPQTMGAFKPPNFSWVVEGRLAGLAMPREPGHYRYLREHGVRHLVSLTERAPPHHGCCPQIQLHRFRVPDFTPPSPEQIQSFLQIVEEANGRGEVWPGTPGGQLWEDTGGHLGETVEGTSGVVTLGGGNLGKYLREDTRRDTREDIWGNTLRTSGGGTP